MRTRTGFVLRCALAVAAFSIAATTIVGGLAQKQLAVLAADAFVGGIQQMGRAAPVALAVEFDVLASDIKQALRQ